MTFDLLPRPIAWPREGWFRRFTTLSILMCLPLAGCRNATESVSVPPASLFHETSAEIGIMAPPSEWDAGTFATPEVTPGGVALLDYDNDGDLDIYQICHAPPGPHAFQSSFANRLYEQQEDGTFLEVAQAAGVDDPGFGHGVAVGDADNDGDLDLYVTNYGPDTFYWNNGDGTFSLATESAGLTADHASGSAEGVGGTGHWSSSAAFLDYDADGDLDLYVVRFASFDPDRTCNDSKGVRDYCGPNYFEGLPDALFRNNGDGTFTNVAAEVGINRAGRGWGVICTDITGNGLTDIYVSNDEQANFLWVNQGNGTFVDEGLRRGVAFSGHGQTEASMGITVGDVNGDERLDLFMTHFRDETNTLYATEGSSFADHSARAGTGAVDLPYTGWGCGFFDFDHDGDLDLAVANGPVMRRPVMPGAALGEFWNAYAEPNLLFQNDGVGKFSNVSRMAGRLTSNVESSRGMAFGDLDQDGDLDLVVTNVDNTCRVFRNDAPLKGSHWLHVQARANGRDDLGAVVTVDAGGAERRRWVRPLIAAYSYASSSQPVAHFGLGQCDKIDSVTITWTNGRRERFAISDIDRAVTVVQGEGTAVTK